MPDPISAPDAAQENGLPEKVTFRHAQTPNELAACFPVISQLRPRLKGSDEWLERASEMAGDGYRILAAWENNRVVAVAGYRITQNLIHDRFLYVDDLVTSDEQRGRGLGASLLTELSAIAVDQQCNRLVLDTAATNEKARRFYKREGLIDAVIGFVKPLGQQT
ncbi:GNAT family N-acetyltransferase [Bosea sp. SSUT16]|uniref:GNAT family N-acetyltransferase n=1 Tax=Bosea spartocytisi TaxID=2773451 RepID=A0A927ECN8_9HYPH|nr:GNAT family N-acetyltransferase [Bosea spartocytisi]MBD3848853.1 GNAT family N-acetyltransferase [Bosea spartocytisi]